MTSAMANSGTAKSVSKGEKPRLGWIDAVKGLTISLVVMEHTTWGVMATLNERPEIFGDIADFAKPFRMPRRPISIASIWAGAALLMAS